MDNPHGKAVLIGVVAGMRCFLAPALLARKYSADIAEGISSSATQAVSAVLAGGELIADKTPYIGNRTDPGPLFGRIVSGAVCGAVVARKNGGKSSIGLIAGGLAAFASAHACYLTRRKLSESTGIPDLVLAVAEDAVAFKIGIAATT